MKPIDFRNHCMEVGTWVNWADTVDQFMHGDPEVEVKGIGVTWLPTDAVLREAGRLGLNFVISHEGAFYPTFVGIPSEDAHHAAKHKLMDELGITLLRLHDTWDKFPKVGVCDTWADFLGFESEPRETDSYYKICNVEGHTAESVARIVLEKTKELGQSFVSVMGDMQTQVRRLAVGTGAISRLAEMHALGADMILGTDDGVHTTFCGLWSVDLGVPVVIVNHPTAELPGMMGMVPYIEEHFPGVPVEYLPCGFPYATIS